MTKSGLWVVQGGVARNRNQGILDGFVLGQTEPVASNTGIAAMGYVDSDLETITGDINYTEASGLIPPDRIIRRKNYKGFVSVNPQNGPVEFQDCKGVGRAFTGDNPTNGSGQTINGVFNCVGDAYPVHFTRVTARPVQGTYQLRNFTGANVGTITRCDVSGGEDNIAVYPSAKMGGQSPWIKWYGNYIHDMCFRADDPSRASDPDNPGWTHNDGGQISGSINGEIIGNAIHAFCDPTMGDYNTLVTSSLKGGYPGGQWNSCLMLTISSGPHQNLKIWYNWLYGANAQIQMPWQDKAWNTSCSWDLKGNRHALSMHGGGPYSGNYQYGLVGWGHDMGPVASSVHDGIYMPTDQFDPYTPSALRGQPIPAATYSAGAQQWGVNYNTPTIIPGTRAA